MKDSDGSSSAGPDPAEESGTANVLPDTGQIGNVIRPPAVWPESPRRLMVEPDSLMAALAGMTSMLTMTQMLEYEAIANVFLAETYDRLNFASQGTEGSYEHAEFTDTVERFLRAEATKEPQTAADGFVPCGSYRDKLSRLTAIREAETELQRPEIESANPEAAPKGPVPTPQGTEAAQGDPSALRGQRRPLPIFPRFRLDQTFGGWVGRLADTADIAEFTTVLGSTVAQTYNRIITATMLVHGLPKFFKRVFAGEFTGDHVEAVSRAAKSLHFEHFPFLDAYLSKRRADVTIETFRKSVNSMVAVLQPAEKRLEEAAKQRRVQITTYRDGTAAVLLSGPAAELQAYFLRLKAFARAVRTGQIGELTVEDADGLTVDDDRSIDALMFDIASRTRPQLTIEVTTRDTTTGESTTTSLPLDIPDSEAADPGDLVNAAEAAANRARREAEEADGPAHTDADSARTDDEAATADSHGTEVTTQIGLILPTHGQWISAQAKMLTTVPVLTLIGESQLPGIFSDGSPVPAEAARAIAGECTTWTRILTDRATGTPIDARALTYRIPASVRLPLSAKWQSCSVPGCIRRAETSEVDHLIPFDHESPERGGTTTFRNAHPLCRPHHQGKTDRKYSVRMTTDGSVEYVFRHGVVTESAPPDQPVNVEHATLFDRYPPPPQGRSPSDVHGPPDGPQPPDDPGTPDEPRPQKQPPGRVNRQRYTDPWAARPPRPSADTYWHTGDDSSDPPPF